MSRTRLIPALLAILTCGLVGLAAAIPQPARAAASISVSQVVSGTPTVGQNVTFTVTLTNAGPDATTEGIEDNAPTGVTFISAVGTGTSCGGTHGNAIIDCQPVALAAGASISLALTVRPTQPGTITNTGEGDPDFLAFSQVSVQIAPAPTDVQVTGSASTGSPNRGATFSYTFQVKDNGPWSVGDVTFSDPLPTQVSFVGAATNNGSACTQAAGTVSCDLGGLNVGQQVNVVITVVAPISPSTFTDTATVTPNVSDTQPSNNSVSVTVQVK